MLAGPIGRQVDCHRELSMPAFPAYNRLKPCRHGTLLYNFHDAYIGRSLDLYGEFSEG